MSQSPRIQNSDGRPSQGDTKVSINVQDVIELTSIAKDFAVEVSKQQELLKRCMALLDTKSSTNKEGTTADNAQGVKTEATVSERDTRVESLTDRLSELNKHIENITASNVSNPTVTEITFTATKTTAESKNKGRSEHEIERLQRHRTRYNRKTHCMALQWSDIDSFAFLRHAQSHKTAYSKSQFWMISDKLWVPGCTANEGKDLLKYDGIFTDDSDSTRGYRQEYTFDDATERHAFLRPEDLIQEYDSAVLNLNNDVTAQNKVAHLNLNHMLNLRSSHEEISDISRPMFLTHQIHENRLSVQDPIFRKLQNEELMEKCYEKSQSLRTGMYSMTEKERLERVAPRDEFEASDAYRIHDHFVPMVFRSMIVMFFLDSPRHHYYILIFLVCLHGIGLLDYPFLLIDHLIQRTFARPPVHVQVNRLGSSEGVQRTPADEDEPIPNWYIRFLYQTVVSFFLLILPWWAPDPYYLQ